MLSLHNYLIILFYVVYNTVPTNLLTDLPEFMFSLFHSDIFQFEIYSRSSSFTCSYNLNRTTECKTYLDDKR